MILITWMEELDCWVRFLLQYLFFISESLADELGAGLVAVQPVRVTAGGGGATLFSWSLLAAVGGEVGSAILRTAVAILLLPG